MKLLASFYLLIVAGVGSVLPKVPQVLGVETTDIAIVEETDTTTDVVAETDTSRRDTIRKARDEAILRRTDLRSELQDKRQAARDELSAKRDEFKTKLESIKDERKRALLEKLDSRFTSINDKWVNNWNRKLSRLSEILAKVSTRADSLEATGVDVSAVRTAINAAVDSIASAQSSLNDQAGSTYIIEINDEGTLGDDVSSLVSQFKEDISSIKDVVKLARSAVHDAFAALRVANTGEEVATDE